jgi:hypothetical protein
MSDKDVINFLTFLVVMPSAWAGYLLFRVQDLKEDLRVAKEVCDYYRGRVGKSELKLLNIKEALDAD